MTPATEAMLTIAPPGPGLAELFFHHWKLVFQRVKHADEIDVEDTARLVGFDLRQFFERLLRNAGIVERDVQPSETIDCECHQPLR